MTKLNSEIQQKLNKNITIKELQELQKKFNIEEMLIEKLRDDSNNEKKTTLLQKPKNKMKTTDVESTIHTRALLDDNELTKREAKISLQNLKAENEKSHRKSEKEFHFDNINAINPFLIFILIADRLKRIEHLIDYIKTKEEQKIFNDIIENFDKFKNLRDNYSFLKKETFLKIMINDGVEKATEKQKFFLETLEEVRAKTENADLNNTQNAIIFIKEMQDKKVDKDILADYVSANFTEVDLSQTEEIIKEIDTVKVNQEFKSDFGRMCSVAMNLPIELDNHEFLNEAFDLNFNKKLKDEEADILMNAIAEKKNLDVKQFTSSSDLHKNNKQEQQQQETKEKNEMTLYAKCIKYISEATEENIEDRIFDIAADNIHLDSSEMQAIKKIKDKKEAFDFTAIANKEDLLKATNIVEKVAEYEFTR